jgi:hypothetical protein
MRPYVSKAKFHPREDSILMATVRALGTANWSDVAATLPGRTARQCRERWNNYVNPNLKTDPWTSSEDELLLEKFEELGRKWQTIARFFARRGRNEVRNRLLALQHKKTRAMPSASPAPSNCPPSAPMVEKETQTAPEESKAVFS